MLNRFVETSFDMAGAKDLQECYENSFALLFAAREGSSAFNSVTSEGSGRIGGGLRFFSSLSATFSK